MEAATSAPGTATNVDQVSIDPRLAALRRTAVVPALNEAESIASVIAEIRAVDPGMLIVVVDDGSYDDTAKIAAGAGARVIRLATNLGIGGAVQTGYQYARERESDIVVQIDGDGQHDPRELSALIAPLLDGQADVVIGSRFAGVGQYRATLARRVGIRFFAGIVSLAIRRHLTDTSSSFRAVNRRGLSVFARDYPHGYLESVESTVRAVKYGLRIKEVPVHMRERTTGHSTLTTVISLYYGFKVLVAVFVSMFQRTSFDPEEVDQ